jgi:hypothetical protein
MYSINKLAFLVTISCHVKFATVELLLNHWEATVVQLVVNIMCLAVWISWLSG